MKNTAHNTHRLTARSKQAGAATLAMAIVLLLLITMVLIYTSRTVLLEQKIAANDFRARQAFEAAESGLQVALAYLGGSGSGDKDNDGNLDPVFDTDGDGIGNVNTMTFNGNSSVTITLSGTFPVVNIQADGLSDDRTAARTIRSASSVADALPNAPDHPLTTRGTVVVDGSANVHNPEGHSTIWSGSDVDLGSNNATATEIADPTGAGYPSCMDTPMTCSLTRSSNKVAVGLDVIEYDSSLANLTVEEMFVNFFGLSMVNYRESRVTLEVAAADANNLASNETNPGVHLGVGEVIWVEGAASLTNITTVGCEVPVVGAGTCPADNLDPSIMIVNGDLETSGTPNFYGLLYVVGSMSMTGNTTVTGAIVVSGDLDSSAGGSLDVWYNSDVLNSTRNNGPLAGAPGSWQDW